MRCAATDSGGAETKALIDRLDAVLAWRMRRVSRRRPRRPPQHPLPDAVDALECLPQNGLQWGNIEHVAPEFTRSP
jgi:hypothetical protein